MSNKNINFDKYISIVSHEIKNSLNPVINLSALMLKDKAGEAESDKREYLKTIERNGRRILAIVDTLSYLNRIKNGITEGNPANISLNDIAENSVRTVSGYYGKSGISCVCINEINSIEVLADSELLKKAVSCITGFYITLRETDSLYFRIASDDGILCVNISDNDSDEKYCTVNQGTYESFDCSVLSETSVLWLSFAKEMIEASGGSAHLVKRWEGDVLFMFTLPAGPGLTGPRQDAGLSEIDIPHDFILMVVDDDPDTLIPLKAIAEYEFGGACQIVYAGDGGECIDLLEKTRPDIILLDLTLPDISGFSLVRNIKNFFAKDNVPVIAFTGHDLGPDRDRILKAGFSDIILKPFDIDEFTEKIRKWKKER